MPLPASVPVGTVIGRWWNTDGSDSTGTIVFLARELIEVPDLPQGVVLPIRYPVDITAGVLNTVLPAGFYDVSVRLSELYRDYKTVEIVAGQTLNLPDAIGVVPEDELLTPVRSVNGLLPDSTGNIVVPTSGVTDHGALTGLTDDDHPQYHTDTRGDVRYYTKAQMDSSLATKENVGVASASMASHLAAVDPHTQYALDSDLTSSLSTKQDKISEHRRYLTDASPDPYYAVPDTGGAWAVFSSPGTLVLPASVGHRINMDFQVLTRGIGDWLVDVAVVTGPTIKRYMSSGTSTPSNAGFPGGYPFTQGALEFQPVYGSGGFTVTSDDISSGNVTLSVVVKSTTSGGRFYASPNFVSQWSMRNIGPA